MNDTRYTFENDVSTSYDLQEAIEEFIERNPNIELELRERVERIQVSVLFAFLASIRGRLKSAGWRTNDLEDDLFEQQRDMACNMTASGLYTHIINTILGQLGLYLQR